jgi:ribosomal protein S6
MGNAYESLAIFPVSMSEAEFDKALSEFVAEIERFGGRVLGVEKLGVRSFARPMHKEESGIYVRAGFEMDGGQLDKFKSRLKLKGDIFRIQILKAEKPRKVTAEKKETVHGQS